MERQCARSTDLGGPSFATQPSLTENERAVETAKVANEIILTAFDDFGMTAGYTVGADLRRGQSGDAGIQARFHDHLAGLRANFLAHLIATRDRLPQTTALRRETPEAATFAYAHVVGGLGIQRSRLV